jgi:opacity protein-like surface antigen
MKQLIQLGIISNLLISSTAFALNPVQGFYVGLLAGISHGPASNQVAFLEDGQIFTGKVTYSSVGGGGGATLGYKLSHFRLEGELLYNRFSTGPLTVDPGGCTIENHNISTPTGVCTPVMYDRFRAKALGYSGSSSVTYGLINFYYDFFSSDSDALVVPYVAIGIGQARIKNFNNLINTNTLVSRGFDKESVNSTAIQGILGLSYYMDDFTWAGMDLRYTTTKSLPQIQDSVVLNKSYALTALMFNINFAFDKGGLY